MLRQHQSESTMKTPEGYIKDDVDKFLKRIGAFVVKPATYGFGVSGNPDRVVCYGGKFIGIEIKREGKTPTPLQELRLKNIREAGGIAIWGDSVEVIIKQLKIALALQV